MADFAEALEKLTDVLAPSGLMLPFAGKSIPDGWLLCNGAAVSRTTYANLFSVIGTTWGTGDGSTTFNLPNCDSRFMEGTTDASKVGTYLEAGLPNITGSVGFNQQACFSVVTGAFTGKKQTLPESSLTGNGTVYVIYSQAQLSLSNQSSIYSGSKLQPPAVQTLIIIKI